MNSAFRYLQERGAIENTTSDDLAEFLSTPRSFYIGFDPTKNSLHLGSLVGIVVAKLLQRYGHTPHLLIGGATARIGDPSGKTAEREKISEEQIEGNVTRLRQFFFKLFPPTDDANSPKILNNHAWFSQLSAIDFLRDLGKDFRLGPMLSKESVQIRLQGEGMSFCEFAYPLLQAQDFLHLFQEEVTLQIGGSDQWGNMVSGIELIRRKQGKKARALTFPLLTSADGKKLGKTEQGAIWLDESLLSPYGFYQSLLQVGDQDVLVLLKLLTFLPLDQIDSIEKQMDLPDAIPNRAQTILAQEVTRFVHGEEGLVRAMRATEIARPGKSAALTGDALAAMAQDLPCVDLDNIVGLSFVELALRAGLVRSKSEAARLVKSRGAYLNNQRVEKPDYTLSQEDLVDERFVLLSSGKKNRRIVRLTKNS